MRKQVKRFTHAQIEDPAAFRAALANGADVNACVEGEQDWTPLHGACLTGDVERVKALLAAGARVDVFAREVPDDNAEDAGYPVHIACEQGAYALVEAILEAAPSAIEHRCPRGRLPIHIVCQTGHAGLLKLLLDYGSPIESPVGEPILDFRMVDEIQNKPLHMAITCGIGKPCELSSLLIEAGADVNARRTHTGSTPLHEAACDETGREARQLLAAGADIHHTDKMGKSALHYAVSDNNVAMASLLLDAGADPDASYDYPLSPREYAQSTPSLTALFDAHTRRQASDTAQAAPDTDLSCGPTL